MIFAGLVSNLYLHSSSTLKRFGHILAHCKLEEDRGGAPAIEGLEQGEKRMEQEQEERGRSRIRHLVLSILRKLSEGDPVKRGTTWSPESTLSWQMLIADTPSSPLLLLHLRLWLLLRLILLLLQSYTSPLHLNKEWTDPPGQGLQYRRLSG